MARKRTRYESMMLLTFLLTALMVVMTGAAQAASVSGATGLIYVPTADTLAERQAEISVRYMDGKLSSSLMYGVFDQIEIGVNNIRATGDPSELGLVLKGTAVQETADRPAIAVGFETGQSYVVASKRLAQRLRAHAGFGYGDLDGLFAGVSFVLSTTTGAGSPATTVLAEYTPQGLNAGVRMVFSPLISVDVALVDLKELSAGVALRTRF